MDYEFCEGLNMIFFHTFTCSPKEMGIPGQEYFAGTHVNPQVTWWKYSDSFMDYINRVQSIVQKGKFVADVLYYYGDHVPNIAVNKGFNRAGALPGYDFDVTNEEVLLKLKVENGNVVVPGGIHYRVLVLPDHKVLSLAVLEKVEQLLKQGANIIGPKPERLVSLVGGKKAQQKFHSLAAKLWGDNPTDSGLNNIANGRTIIPMEFTPYASSFVIFRKTIPTTKQGTESSNYPVLKTIKEIQGPWQVAFNPDWGGPASIEFKTLTDWAKHSNEGIKYYSGDAIYTNTFEFSPVEGKQYWLQLNQIEDVGIASIKLNGRNTGITWTKPFCLEITADLKTGLNKLEIIVINSWQNRLIGDRGKPQEARFTKTNINIRDDWKLRKSGLQGPVEIKSN